MLSYICSEFKPFYQHHEIRPLGEYQEARGKLLRVFESEGQCMGVWSWGCCSFPAELQGELCALVGQEVAILRLDGRYHVRAVD